MNGSGSPFEPVVGGASAMPPAGEAVPSGGPLAVVITGEDWLQAICPFLRARDGSWRSASPAREHRCWAMDPPGELPVLTQQRLCLIRPHDNCERFLHARELRSASLASTRVSTMDTPAVGVPSGAGGQRRSATAADTARDVAAGLLRLPRSVLVALAALAGALVLLVAVMGLGGGSGSPSPVPTPIARASGDPSVTAEPSPGPDGQRRYRIREGDTLRTIADRFDVSVRQIRLANDLGDPPRLEVGMVIIIPAGS